MSGAFVVVVLLSFLLTFTRLVQSMEFSCIVFDTAPTGHTLRLLSFPSTLEKSLSKFMGLSNSFGPMLQQVCGGQRL